MTRSTRILLATTSLLLCPVLASPALGAAAVGNPVVYHSPDGLGTPSSITPFVISAQDGQQLHLFIDYQNDGDADPSTTGTMCVNANGDETCAFDVLLTMVTDAAAFASFEPAAAGIVGRIDPATQRTLRVNGIDVDGMPMPAEIGTLTVDAAGAHQVQIAVLGRHRVGAAGQMDGIQSQVIVNLPEPGALLLQGSGIAAVALLARWRRRRARGA